MSTGMGRETSITQEPSQAERQTRHVGNDQDRKGDDHNVRQRVLVDSRKRLLEPHGCEEQVLSHGGIR